MITPKNRDMNRSRDVEGPKLERSYDKETNVKDSAMKSGSSFGEQTGTISKHSLSELHHGDHETPLTALGQQSVVESHSMGSDSPDHVPTLHKGGIKDQSHFGGGKAGYSEVSKSLGKDSPRGMGRSIAKKAMYSEKKHMK